MTNDNTDPEVLARRNKELTDELSDAFDKLVLATMALREREEKLNETNAQLTREKDLASQDVARLTQERGEILAQRDALSKEKSSLEQQIKTLSEEKSTLEEKLKAAEEANAKSKDTHTEHLKQEVAQKEDLVQRMKTLLATLGAAAIVLVILGLGWYGGAWYQRATTAIAQVERLGSPAPTVDGNTTVTKTADRLPADTSKTEATPKVVEKSEPAFSLDKWDTYDGARRLGVLTEKCGSDWPSGADDLKTIERIQDKLGGMSKSEAQRYYDTCSTDGLVNGRPTAVAKAGCVVDPMTNYCAPIVVRRSR